jgi:hypothetical protein
MIGTVPGPPGTSASALGPSIAGGFVTPRMPQSVGGHWFWRGVVDTFRTSTEPGLPNSALQVLQKCAGLLDRKVWCQKEQVTIARD